MIPFLLALSIEAACKQQRISRPTIYNWLKDSTFRAALKAAQDEVFDDAITRLKSSVGKAVDKLMDLMEKSKDEQIQVRAAEDVIEYAAKLHQNENLEKRVALLEERLKETLPWQRN